jgi:hypothetical protein
MQKWEYRSLETRSVPDSQNTIMFFDHYAKEYKGQRSDLDNYFVKLGAEGWKLTMRSYEVNDNRKIYVFRRSKE